MATIEIIDNPYKFERYELFLDGRLITDVSLSLHRRSDGESKYSAVFQTLDAARPLLTEKWPVLRQHFAVISVEIPTDIPSVFMGAVIKDEYVGNRLANAEFTVEIHPNVDSWSGSWSINAYFATLEALFLRMNISDLTLVQKFDEDDGLGSTWFSGYLVEPELAAAAVTLIDDWIPFFDSLLRQTEQFLAGETESGALRLDFTFHPSVRAACEQYLMYFAQFLADLGVDAHAEVRQKAGETLFTVTPASGTEALGKIKEALDTYLSLPYNPNFQQDTAQSREFAVLQLQAEVAALQSKIAQARVWLQLQGERIEQLELENFGYRQQVENLQWAALPSATDEKPVSEDETILWGAVTVTSLEIKALGLKVNTPHLLRALRRRPWKSVGTKPPLPPELPQLPSADQPEG